MESFSKNPALSLGAVNSVGLIAAGIWVKNQLQDKESKINTLGEEVKKIDGALKTIIQQHGVESRGIREGFNTLQKEGKKNSKKLKEIEKRLDRMDDLAFDFGRLLELLKGNIEVPKEMIKKYKKRKDKKEESDSDSDKDSDSDSDSDDDKKKKKKKSKKEESDSDDEEDNGKDDKSSKIIEEVRKRRQNKGY